MFRDDGAANADWYAWDRPVRAPAAGVVVAAVNDQPDYEVGRTRMDERLAMQNPMLLYGNHLILDHGGGEYSMLAHLRQGSVTARPGMRVRRGETIGRVGYSGAVYTIHLHYELRRGAGIDVDGLPSYFEGVRRPGDAPGARAVRIESGDVVESR
jgi:murein DD-endopeptidase MepM/ murein hydrolase activator NlpD